MKKYRWIVFLFVLCLVSVSFAQDGKTVPENQVPKWVLDYFEFRTAGTGRWVADNSKYKSKDEPFDEYVTEWTWSAGKKSIKGRLYAVANKKETGTFVEFRMHWHPEKRSVITQVFAADGSYGQGELEFSGSDSQISIEHTIYDLQRGSRRELIKEFDSKHEFRTEDFTFTNGKWQPLRTYVWRRVPAA